MTEVLRARLDRAFAQALDVLVDPQIPRDKAEALLAQIGRMVDHMEWVALHVTTDLADLYDGDGEPG